MNGWGEFTLAMALFMGSHFLPRVGGLRDRLIGAWGRRMYFSVYGLLSLALLAWIVVAAGRAPHVELWPQLPWMRWVPNLAMPLALVLACCGIGMAQPHTLGGSRKRAFDPQAPGFAAVCRHPVLMALGLWALSHMVPNGDLAHVILFGGFAALAFGAMPLFDRRARHDTALLEATTRFSLAPLAHRGWRRANRGLLGRCAMGLVLWLALLHLHATVIGVSPFPV
ncbi:NnrU family protein [Oceaniglobus trochenteri]|uniref:NnrU family protein n=1 Tax=Oceaniglobus trochenteri TaxID=2763260 RepID=UPI001CFF5BA5|nr:NnrU family protein [Oceaniglobus trochenteri]